MINKLFLAVLLCLSPVLGSTLSYADVRAEERALAGQAETININSADAQALAHGLVGVGLSRAQEIVRYRESYGPFVVPEDLLEVKGIGRSTLDKNRDRITLD